MKNVIIFGSSGHGSVVLDCLEKEGKFKVVGFVDSFKRKGWKKNGYVVLGTEYDLPYLCDKYNLFGGIVAVGDNYMRKTVVDKIHKIVPHFQFVSTVHPTATIGKDVTIGKGVVIMPGAVVNANCVISDFCILNTYSVLEHDSQMLRYSSLAPKTCVGGNFTLGTFSAVCLGSNIIENISIREHTVIGAGSLVVNDITSHVVAYGTPAKIIRNRIEGEKYLSGGKTAMVFRAIK